MSASIFHWDWFTDPPWDRVSLWWLDNYIKNVRNDPRLLETMRANKAEFEVVPVPLAVLRAMAASAEDRERIPAEPAVDQAPVMRTVTIFAKALQARDLDGMMKTVSRTYFDALGRDAERLKGDLAELIERLPGLHVRTDKIETASQVGGGQVVARLDVEWQAGGRRAMSRVEMFLGRANVKDAWHIESIRTV